MAARSKNATLAYSFNDETGAHAIGVTVGKLFVPFVTVDAARFEQLREAAENSQDNDDSTDEETS